ncbi:PREDICTED: RRP12-like protein [Priapulus caudatus]|uniref:RRP12-like protein n=1 Tax=Priapulus caudatus TaxID=37621 RepID=A0ABM1EYE4_PRICU|nr:PREDICTED: RRP12-like protein [Priapulus caudatus]
MNEDTSRHFRFKIKSIFTKLIKKFGYEMVHGMSPERYHKVLSNVRRELARSKRKKLAGERGGSDDDDEDEEDETEGGKNRGQPESLDDLLRDTDSELEEGEEAGSARKKPRRARKQTTAAWLEDKGEEDIVDFLDPGVARKVMGTKPATASVEKKSKTEFKMASDGRMIITESEEDKKRSKSAAKTLMDDVDDMMETMDVSSAGRKGGKKRARDADSDDDNAGQVTPQSYKAGGTGIHRPIAVAKRTLKDQRSASGLDYKAKKAGGDIKKKNKPDPFAYIPLNMQSLNKRKKAKFQGQFKGIMKGVKKGAAKGRKGRRK